MATPRKRLAWDEMDHDAELLWEEVVRRNAVNERGPIPEFLAKKQAEQENKTYLGYRTALSRFRDFLGEDATVGDVNESTGHSFLTELKQSGLSDNSIAERGHSMAVSAPLAFYYIASNQGLQTYLRLTTPLDAS